MKATWLIKLDDGSERCAYCGQPCGTSHAADIKKTWSDWPSLSNPEGRHRCRGCEIAMDERRSMRGKEKPQKVRTYSWLIKSDGEMQPATKGDMGLMRDWCLNPPVPPYAVSLSSGGQKHFLYRAVACLSKHHRTVFLDGEPISYYPQEMESALLLADRISAATGKVCLASPLEVGAAARIFDYWSDAETIVGSWSVTQTTPLGRLVSFLAMPKKKAEETYASDFEPR